MVKLKNQRDNLSETPEQKKFNNFLEHIRKEQKDIDINSPDEMLEYLNSLKKLMTVIWKHL